MSDYAPPLLGASVYTPQKGRFKVFLPVESKQLDTAAGGTDGSNQKRTLEARMDANRTGVPRPHVVRWEISRIESGSFESHSGRLTPQDPRMMIGIDVMR